MYVADCGEPGSSNAWYQYQGIKRSIIRNQCFNVTDTTSTVTWYPTYSINQNRASKYSDNFIGIIIVYGTSIKNN